MEIVVFQLDIKHQQISIEDKDIFVPEVGQHLVWCWGREQFETKFPTCIIPDDILTISYEPENDIYHIQTKEGIDVYQSVTQHQMLLWINNNIEEIKTEGIVMAIEYEGNI